MHAHPSDKFECTETIVYVCVCVYSDNSFSRSIYEYMCVRVCVYVRVKKKMK